jgi:AMP nucleosidase
MKLVTPEPLPLKSFTDPVLAWEYVCEIYERNTSFIREHLVNLTAGKVPPGKVRAHYPKAQMLTTSFQQNDNSRLAYGFLHSPGLYQTTLTQPRLYHKYLIENFSLILRHHGGEIQIGESDTPIPLHFAVDPTERVEGEVLLDVGVPLRDLFDVPDLAHMDDEIANGTFIPPAGGPYPLAAFTAPRVDYSLHRLNHYTGTTPEHFQNFVIFTNYQFYIEEFTRLAQQWMAEGHEFYESFVEPGNFVMARALRASRRCQPIT